MYVLHSTVQTESLLSLVVDLVLVQRILLQLIFLGVYANLEKDTPKDHFTIAINDDVTGLSLEKGPTIDVTPEGTTSCLFWGLGSDGTVGANKNSIKIIGDHTDKYAQAYFDYDSKKSGGVTMSHLRFGDDPIKSTYLINKADFVACHCAPYLTKYNMVQDLKDGGTFLLNCSWTPEEVGEHLPGQVKAYLAKHNISSISLMVSRIGKEIGLGWTYQYCITVCILQIIRNHP